MAERLGVLLLSGSHERAHYAFVMATAAAAIGRTVTMMVTNAGCHALLPDWSGLSGSAHDAVLQARGVAGFAELREAASQLGVRLIACEAGLRAEAIDPAALLPGVEVAGVASFLHEVGDGQIVTC